ncbi:MAG: DUF4235 domain-containing protein [Bifidobacteriaceae bacterium]|jgi:hypothetical protein|nr:DUF4235 domain-containing protein [Bifidobacteriaceae bacterium]
MRLTKWLYTTVASVVAGFVAARAVRLAWRVVSGRAAPADSEDPESSTAEVAVFAAALAAAVAAAQTLATRGALKLVRRSEAKDLTGPPDAAS